MIRALDFYQNVLGFQIIEQQTNIAKLSAGGQSPILTLEKQEKPIPLKPGDTGLFHIAYLLPSRRDLAVMLLHLLHIGLNTWNSKGGTIPEAESVGMKSYSISVIKEERERIAERLTKLGFFVEVDGCQYLSQDPSGNIIYF